MRRRRELHNFDDFYKFLLSRYDDVENNSSKFQQIIDNKSCEVCKSRQVKSVDASHQSTSIDNNVTNEVRQLSMSTDNATVNIAATNDVDENSSTKPALVFDSFANAKSNQTLSDLCKTIVKDLIRNPKTFKGNKDDVNEWIEEIEHLLDIAHKPDISSKPHFIFITRRCVRVV